MRGAEKLHTSEIYRDLRQKLLVAALVPGDRLKPEVLRQAYGCSSNTIRDVLLRLTATGLVEFREQRGFRASPSSPRRRHDVTSFRILLEQEGAGLSMRRGGLEWEARLAAAHYKLGHIEREIARGGVRGHMTLWSEAEWDFHDTLISASGIALLRETFRNVYDQFRQQMVSLERDFGRGYFEAIIAEHQAILDAALARDQAACRRAIYDHLRRNLVPGAP